MLNGLRAMVYKEAIQVRRDPATRIIFVIPVIQLLVFGYAIETEVRHVPTVVFDADRRSASREFLGRFESTGVFRITGEAVDPAGVRAAIVSGRAKVGILIPPRFSDDLLHGRMAQVQVLVDGSNNTVATQALAAANGSAMQAAVAQFEGRGLRRPTPRRRSRWWSPRRCPSVRRTITCRSAGPCRCPPRRSTAWSLN